MELSKQPDSLEERLEKYKAMQALHLQRVEQYTNLIKETEAKIQKERRDKEEKERMSFLSEETKKFLRMLDELKNEDET